MNHIDSEDSRQSTTEALGTGHSSCLRVGLTSILLASSFTILAADSSAECTTEYLPPAAHDKDGTHNMIRCEAIEDHEARRVATVQTDSGAVFEFFQAGGDENANRPVSIDDQKINVMMNFLVESFGLLKQDLISASDIEDFQERAAGGQLDVTFTVLLTVDPDHSIERGSESFGSDGCKPDNYSGMALSAAEEARTNPVVLAGVCSGDTPQLTLMPRSLPDAYNVTELSMEYIQEMYGRLTLQDTLMLTVIHELLHVFPGAIFGKETSPDQEHQQLIWPIMGYVDTILSGQYLENPPELANPFDFPVSEQPSNIVGE